MYKWIKSVIALISRDKCEFDFLDARKRGMVIGENVSILNSKIDYGHAFLISIGDNVTITGATILAHDASIKKELGYSKVGKVVIGSNVFVGSGAIILPGIKIGNNVIVGAGCVVSKNISDNCVVVGNPVQVLCTYEAFIEKHRNKIETGKNVWNTYWKDKDDEEKKCMMDSLNNGCGYDI